MDMISALPEELLHEVSSFLIPREICSFFALLSVELRKTYLESFATWRQVLGSVSDDIIQPLLLECEHGRRTLNDYDNPRSASYAKMARAIAGMEDLTMGNWCRTQYIGGDELFSEQEAHSSVLMTTPRQQKLLAIFPGWGRATKTVEMFDVTALPSVGRVAIKVNGKAGYFKYGHTSTKINDSLVILFGGMTSGGYRGAINLVTVVNMKYNEDCENFVAQQTPYSHLDTRNVKEEAHTSSSLNSRGNKRSRDVGNDAIDSALGVSDPPLSKTKASASEEKGEDTEEEKMEETCREQPSLSVRPLVSYVADSSGHNSEVAHGNGAENEHDHGSGAEDEYDFEGEYSNDSTEDSFDDGMEVEEFGGDVDGDYYVNDDDSGDDERFISVEVCFEVLHQLSSPFVSVNTPGSPPTPTPRGYHTATAIRICRQDYMLVWGGLGNAMTLATDEDMGHGANEPENFHHVYEGTRTLSHLECMNCDTMGWHTQVNFSGSEPAPRFGHGCTFHPRSNSIVLVGGSDGTDLMRNGEELREVYVLKIVTPTVDKNDIYDAATCFNNTHFIWSQVSVCVSPSSRNEVLVPGRCHSSALICKDKLLIFGGSAKSTNAVVGLDLSFLLSPLTSTVSEYSVTSPVGLHENTEAAVLSPSPSVVLFAPKISGTVPTGRVSALCAVVGRYFFIQGGYEVGKGCLSDSLVLDMSHSTSDPPSDESYD